MSAFYRIISQKSNALNGRTVEHIGDYGHYRVTSQPLDSDKHNPNGQPIVFDMCNDKWKFVEVRQCPWQASIWCPTSNKCDSKCPKHPEANMCKHIPMLRCVGSSQCSRCVLYPGQNPRCPMCCDFGKINYCPMCGKKL